MWKIGFDLSGLGKRKMLFFPTVIGNSKHSWNEDSAKAVVMLSNRFHVPY
jgi:hypothetical protein